jgi:hypothetical protein
MTSSTLRSGCVYSVRLIFTDVLPYARKRLRPRRALGCAGPCIRSFSNPHLENDFQFDRHPERKALHSKHQARRYPVFSEDVAEKFRGSIGNVHLVG